MLYQIFSNSNSVYSLFTEHKNLISGFKEDFFSSRLFNEISYNITIAVASTSVCATICISKNI